MSNRLTPLVLPTLLFALAASSRATPIPSEKEHVICLDGTWRFKLEQPGIDAGPQVAIGPHRPIVTPKAPEPFERADYVEDGSWHDLKVPGNWEMAGYSPATYDAPDNAIGLYRLAFDVPADWQGREVRIDFDGVQNGAEVFCNGQPVDVDEPTGGRKNYHESGWTAFQADLTPALKFGAKNELAVRVVKNTPSADLDDGDYFFLGGIYRTVRLFTVPKAHAQSLAVRTVLTAVDQAEVRVLLTLAPGARAAAHLGALPAVVGEADAQGRLELVMPVDRPKLWSAEHPNLYALFVDVKDEAGQTTEHLSQRVGIRQMSIKDGVLLLNGVPVKFTGMCRHDLSATLGTAIDEAGERKDLEMMKAANVNAVRTSHYPYSSKFYDLCDEMGVYVMDEVAACWTPTDTDELSAAFAQRARETVRRDMNHASVVVWAIGNENKPGKNNKLAADAVKQLDPTRPRLVSWREAEHADVELDDAHYTVPADIAFANRQFDRREKYPKIYLENPNTWEVRNGADFGCTYRWGAVLDRVWREVWDDDHVPGNFCWEWADRAVVDGCKLKLYDYYPQTGIQIVKVKGLVDAFRNPRPNLYDVKRVYAPVKLEENVTAAADGVTVHATNRYAFTDFSELKATWRLLDDGKAVANGSAALALPPRTRGDLKVALPAEALARADALRLDFDAADGRNVITYQFALRPARSHAPAMTPGEDLGGITFPRFNFAAVTADKRPDGWKETVRHVATLASIDVQTGSSPSAKRLADEAALYAMPLAEVRAVDADVMLASDAIEPAPGKVPAKAAAKQPAADAAPHPLKVAHLRVDFVGGYFSYRLNWYNHDQADVQELGWAFPVAATTAGGAAGAPSAERFAWHRKAYWPYYPPDHIARPEGIASPDSADVQLTKMDRPDAFDFNSTKYDCDWVTLGHGAGGLALRFDPADRQHCRGNVAAAGGRCELIVDKVCAPPRDISSNVVTDFYFRIERSLNIESAFDVGGMR